MDFCPYCNDNLIENNAVSTSSNGNNLAGTTLSRFPSAQFGFNAQYPSTCPGGCLYMTSSGYRCSNDSACMGCGGSWGCGGCGGCGCGNGCGNGCGCGCRCR